MEPNETADLTQDEDLLESLEKLLEEIPQDENGVPQLDILQEMYLLSERKTTGIVRIFLDAIGAEEPSDIDSLPEERQIAVLEEHLLNEIEKLQKKGESGSPDSSSSDEEKADLVTSFEDEQGPEGLDRMVETRSRTEQSKRQALRATQDAEFEASLKADKEKQEREDQKRKEEQETKTWEEEASHEIDKMNALPLDKKRRLAVEAFERRTKQKEQ
jgi:hypothetical protein